MLLLGLRLLHLFPSSDKIVVEALPMEDQFTSCTEENLIEALVSKKKIYKMKQLVKSWSSHLLEMINLLVTCVENFNSVRARVYVKKMRRSKNINLNTQAVKMLNNSSNGSTGGKGVDLTSGSILEMLQIAEHDRKPAGDNNSEITQSATNQQEKRDMQKKEGATVILADELANQDWKSNSEEKEKIKSLESMRGGKTIFSKKGED